MSVFTNGSESNELQIAIAGCLEKLTNILSNITEFKQNKLRSYSLLQNNKYIEKLLSYEIKNIKHIKRKHSQEILTAYKFLSNYVKESGGGFLSNMFNRDKI